MKHLFFCFLIEMLFCGASVPVFERIRATCIDAESKKAIPHATVFVAKANLFTNADSSGVFEIDIAGDDTLLITSIGYKEKKNSCKRCEKKCSCFASTISCSITGTVYWKAEKDNPWKLKR